MDATTPSRHLYDEVRRLVLALLAREGVTGVVLLDRGGRLVMHEGTEPVGDVEGLAARFLHIARATAGLGEAPTGRTSSWFARDNRHGAWLASAGAGLTLVVFLEADANPGLAWRLGERIGGDLRRLFDGPAQAPDPSPTPEPEDEAERPRDHGPFWE